VFPHPLREQDLAERIVDFVRAGMEQVFALQVNLRAAKFLGKSFGKIKWRGTACEIAQQLRQLISKMWIAFGALVFGCEFAQRRHQRFRNEHSAVNAEVTVRIGQGFYHARKSKVPKKRGKDFVIIAKRPLRRYARK